MTGGVCVQSHAALRPPAPPRPQVAASLLTALGAANDTVVRSEDDFAALAVALASGCVQDPPPYPSPFRSPYRFVTVCH
jgi:hypothetical protein